MSNVRVMSRSGEAKVELSARASDARAAAMRVRLKLGAVSYADSRHGADASPELSGAALIQLCELSARYYAALTGSPDILHHTLVRPEVAGQLARLRLASLSYASTRHGVDACIELARDALGGLCGAAIAYCQAVLGVDPEANRVVDRTLQLDGGG